MLNFPVLVLNQDYSPLHICAVRRALILLLRRKAELVKDGRGTLHTPTLTIPLPSIIRLFIFIRRPYYRKKLTRREVFLRDKYTCQYCGQQTRDLTVDHVLPRHRGGEHSWDNMVSACIPCNRRKAGHTPQEAGMKLFKKPTTPPPTPSWVPFYLWENHPEWQDFSPLLG